MLEIINFLESLKGPRKYTLIINEVHKKQKKKKTKIHNRVLINFL